MVLMIKNKRILALLLGLLFLLVIPAFLFG